MLDVLENLAAMPQVEHTYLNGSEPVPKKQVARLDPLRRVFITSRGNEIELSKNSISGLIAERITNEGKPQIPRREVTILGKHKQMEANPEDPGYLALMAEWEENQRIRGMRYTFVVGVKGQPPQEFIDEQLIFFPNATAQDLKYLWVASQLPDEDIQFFVNCLLGQNTPTTEGIEEAANFSESK